MGSTDSMKERQRRNIAFDILRIIAMLMVTMLHITGHGLGGVEIEAFSGVYWIVLIFNTFSLVAVNCFVLISGYFLSQKNVSLKKIVALWFQVWTYSVAIYLVLCAMPGVDVNFSIPALVECLCPLLSNQYWFFTCYLLLYLFSPVLNRLMDAWDQQEHQKILIVLIAVFSVIPSINIWGDSFGTNRGYSLVWFSVLYLIAGYIRKYPLRLPVHPALVYAVPSVVLCALHSAITAWNPGIRSVQEILTNQTSYNGPLVLCASVGLLIWAQNSSLQPNARITKVITTSASLTFGVYLLHDHGMIRQVLWNDWVRLAEVSNNGAAFLLRVIIVLIGIFVCGLAAEFIRQKLMGCFAHILKTENILDWKDRNETTKQN